MDEREQRDLAQRLVDDSNVLDFETALELAKRRPAEAERLLRMGEEFTQGQEERARAAERRRLALREEFG